MVRCVPLVENTTRTPVSPAESSGFKTAAALQAVHIASSLPRCHRSPPHEEAVTAKVARGGADSQMPQVSGVYNESICSMNRKRQPQWPAVGEAKVTVDGSFHNRPKSISEVLCKT